MKTQDARSLSPDALFDLRTRVVAAVGGGMSQSEAARVFAVHRSAVNRWCQATSTDALRPRRRGRKSAGGPLAPDQEAALLDAIRTRHPADLARWRAEVYPAIAAEARRCRAEIHWLDETGVRTDHNPGTGYAPRGRP